MIIDRLLFIIKLIKKNTYYNYFENILTRFSLFYFLKSKLKLLFIIKKLNFFYLIKFASNYFIILI